MEMVPGVAAGVLWFWDRFGSVATALGALLALPASLWPFPRARFCPGRAPRGARPGQNRALGKGHKDAGNASNAPKAVATEPNRSQNHRTPAATPGTISMGSGRVTVGARD